MTVSFRSGRGPLAPGWIGWRRLPPSTRAAKRWRHRQHDDTHNGQGPVAGSDYPF